MIGRSGTGRPSSGVHHWAVLARCRALIALSAAMSLGACSSPTVPPTSAPPSPTPVATPAATASETSVAGRPSPGPGQPTIADPYWLLESGTGTGTFTDASGAVIRTDTTTSWEVIDGGDLEGTILINGELVGSLQATVTERSDGVEADPLEEQFGPLDPDAWTPAQAKTRSVATHGGTSVWIRRFDLDGEASSAAAYWWSAERDRWFALQAFDAARLEPMLVALLGARSP